MTFKAYLNDGFLESKRMCFMRQCDVNSWLCYTRDAVEYVQLEFSKLPIGKHLTTCVIGGDLMLVNLTTTHDVIYLTASSLLGRV